MVSPQHTEAKGSTEGPGVASAKVRILVEATVMVGAVLLGCDWVDGAGGAERVKGSTHDFP